MFTSFVRRVGLAVGIAAAALATGTPSKAQTIAEIEQKGRVTIGVLTGIPPYDTVDASGAPDASTVS